MGVWPVVIQLVGAQRTKKRNHTAERGQRWSLPADPHPFTPRTFTRHRRSHAPACRRLRLYAHTSLFAFVLARTSSFPFAFAPACTSLSTIAPTRTSSSVSRHR